MHFMSYAIHSIHSRSKQIPMKNGMAQREVLRPHQLHTMIRLIIGLVTGLVGVANMLTVIVPGFNWGILLGEWPVDIRHGIHKLLVVVGFFLIMLSYAMMRGKRQAWYTTLILLIFSAFLYILSGGLVLATGLAGALVLVLMIFSRHFGAKSDPPSIWRGYMLSSVVWALSLCTLSPDISSISKSRATRALRCN